MLSQQLTRALAARLWRAAFRLNPHVMALQAKLAYGVARSEIEVYCEELPLPPQEGSHWYNTDSIHDPGDLKSIRMSVAYLEGAGLIKRHHQKEEWVRILELPSHQEGSGIDVPLVFLKERYAFKERSTCQRRSV